MAPIGAGCHTAITKTNQIRGITDQPLLEEVIRKIAKRTTRKTTLPASKDVLIKWATLVYLNTTSL
jgi:hypothetical protein